jgi:hypothetical protein
MKNYQLYARILRLSHLLSPAMSASHVAEMDRIVTEFVIVDPQLVWC